MKTYLQMNYKVVVMSDSHLFIYFCEEEIPEECLERVNGVKSIVRKGTDPHIHSRYLAKILYRMLK